MSMIQSELSNVRFINATIENIESVEIQLLSKINEGIELENKYKEKEYALTQLFFRIMNRGNAHKIKQDVKVLSNRLDQLHQQLEGTIQYIHIQRIKETAKRIASSKVNINRDSLTVFNQQMIFTNLAETIQKELIDITQLHEPLKDDVKLLTDIQRHSISLHDLKDEIIYLKDKKEDKREFINKAKILMGQVLDLIKENDIVSQSLVSNLVASEDWKKVSEAIENLDSTFIIGTVTEVNKWVDEIATCSKQYTLGSLEPVSLQNVVNKKGILGKKDEQQLPKIELLWEGSFFSEQQIKALRLCIDKASLEKKKEEYDNKFFALDKEIAELNKKKDEYYNRKTKPIDTKYFDYTQNIDEKKKQLIDYMNESKDLQAKINQLHEPVIHIGSKREALIKELNSSYQRGILALEKLKNTIDTDIENYNELKKISSEMKNDEININNINELTQKSNEEMLSFENDLIEKQKKEKAELNDQISKQAPKDEIVKILNEAEKTVADFKEKFKDMPESLKNSLGYDAKDPLSYFDKPLNLQGLEKEIKEETLKPEKSDFASKILDCDKLLKEIELKKTDQVTMEDMQKVTNINKEIEDLKKKAYNDLELSGCAFLRNRYNHVKIFVIATLMEKKAFKIASQLPPDARQFKPGYLYLWSIAEAGTEQKMKTFEELCSKAQQGKLNPDQISRLKELRSKKNDPELIKAANDYNKYQQTGKDFLKNNVANGRLITLPTENTFTFFLEQEAREEIAQQYVQTASAFLDRRKELEEVWQQNFTKMQKLKENWHEIQIKQEKQVDLLKSQLSEKEQVWKEETERLTVQRRSLAEQNQKNAEAKLQFSKTIEELKNRHQILINNLTFSSQNESNMENNLVDRTEKLKALQAVFA